MLRHQGASKAFSSGLPVTSGPPLRVRQEGAKKKQQVLQRCALEVMIARLQIPLADWPSSGLEADSQSNARRWPY